MIVIAISRIYDLSRQRYVIIFKLQRVGKRKYSLWMIREWTVNMKNTGNDDHTFIAGILFLFL
ncbi:MAG: hypothetical protein EGP90_05865 [Bacteroides sp.]|nr:hypothetical protein [Bacteroides sp.]